MNYGHIYINYSPVSIDFPWNSKRDALFHRIAFDYSIADWEFFGWSFERCSMRWYPVFSIWKLLGVLQKAYIKIVASTIYSYQYFLLHTLFSYVAKWKVVVIAVFLSKLGNRLLFSYMYYKTILVWGLISVWVTNTTHCLL